MVAVVAALAAAAMASVPRDAAMRAHRPLAVGAVQRDDAIPADHSVVATSAPWDAMSPADRLTVLLRPFKPAVVVAQTQASSGDYVGTDISLPAVSLRQPLQLVSLGNWPDPRSYFAPGSYALFGEVSPAKPTTEPMGELPHRASIDPNKAHKAGRTTRRVMPSTMKPLLTRIQFSAPVLAPMAHTLFCLHYPSDCRVQKIVFRGGVIKFTTQRRAELERINAEVNRSIIPKRDTQWLRGAGWLIAPKAGDCNDYAVTKRHELLALGWPERALLLSEVVTSWGEHHLVLVVRTNEGDLVADNLYPKVRIWLKAPYQWVRIQSPKTPNSWSSIANAAA
jgi:predicted transglutaminase-like cysteine proteinase